MITTFTYSAEAVKKAEGGAFINRTGEYVCVVSQASTYETQNGAQMIRLVLKDQTTASVCQTDICVIAKDGNPTFGMGMFNALQKIAGVEKAETVSGKVYSIFDPKKPEDGFRIPAVEKKTVGVVLQRENFFKTDGKAGHRMNVVCFFDPTTRKTASEIERGSEAHRVDSLKTLKDKDRSAISQTKTTEVPAGYDETDPF